MPSLKTKKRAAGLSPHQTTLSVSWLGNQFRALAVQRGQVEGRWTSPEPVEGTTQFLTLLRRAAAETNYKGATVSLVLAHSRLAHQLAEVPPAKGAALSKLIARQAQQQSLFPGEPVWSYQPADSSKTAQRIVLNLFPKALLGELTTAAEKAGLFLTSVMPVPALLQNQLLDLPTKEDEIVVLAAETGPDATTVLVGRSDGRVLLARTLAGTWNANLSRMALDLKRTVLFVNQQFAANVGKVFLFGANAAQHAPAVQEVVQLPVQPSPVEFTEDYWPVELLRMAVGESQNLITREQQMAPQRQLAARVLGVASVVIILVAGGITYNLHRLQQRQEENLRGAERESNALQVQRRKLEELHAELAQRQELVHVVADGRNPPLAGWLLSYLNEAVPSELVVTNLQFKRESQHWRLRLAGTLQTASGAAPSSPEALGRALTTFTNRLKSGPFKVEFQTQAPVAAPAPVASGTNVFQRLGVVAPPPPPPKPMLEDAFVVEGLVQP